MSSSDTDRYKADKRPIDAAVLFAAAERLGSTSDAASVLGLLKAGADALGAESAVFVSVARDVAVKPATRLMTTCDPVWLQHYLDSGSLVEDPWLLYATHRSEPIVASELDTGSVSATARDVLATHRAFASAVLAPAHSGHDHERVGLLCLGSSQRGYFEADQPMRARIGARLLAAVLNDWWLANTRHELLVTARITPAELDLLRRQLLGHSSKRIAASLNVTQSSINSRFQRMNMKLGVPNRRAAVRLALQCGLLFG
jgi:DNA-binding CsgD family transcriptional regulator